MCYAIITLCALFIEFHSINAISFKDDEHALKELERLEQQYERHRQMPVTENSKLLFNGDL